MLFVASGRHNSSSGGNFTAKKTIVNLNYDKWAVIGSACSIKEPVERE